MAGAEEESLVSDAGAVAATAEAVMEAVVESN